MLDQAEPLVEELYANDARAEAARTTPRAQAPLAPPTFVWTVGLRVEGEVLGLIAGGAAVSPALTVAFERGAFGAMATGILQVVPGVRLEGRFHPGTWAVRPVVSLGGTLFGTAFAPRAAVGLLARVGPVQLSFDAAGEYFVSMPLRIPRAEVLAWDAWRASWRVLAALDGGTSGSGSFVPAAATFDVAVSGLPTTGVPLSVDRLEAVIDYVK